MLTAAFVMVAQWPSILEIPSGIHAWAQWDRYALALGFLENGFNFFKPQTFVYNHQFPSDWIQASSSTITAVDFPLHEWLVALIMKMTGNHSIIVFKIYILAFALIGLFFFWKTALTLTGNVFTSFVALVFATASPVFLFYAGCPLPSIPSLASATAGIFFYVQFKKRNRFSDFYISILWLTLAALTRTTFVIPLLSVFLAEMADKYKNHHPQKKFLPAVLSVLTLAGYFFYNRFLFLSHGSMFLNELMPPKSWEQAKDCFQVMFENWKFEWFTAWHYVAFLLVLFFAYLKKKEKEAVPDEPFSSALSKWISFCLTGCFLFFIAMLRQFPHHDYYFLDTFFMPFCLLFLWLMRKSNLTFKNAGMRTTALIFSGLMILHSYKTIKHRHEDLKSERFLLMLDNFSGAGKWLDQLGIPRNSKVLIADVPAPNPPFILMKRKGFVILSSNITRPEHVKAALQFPFDYMLIETCRQSEILKYIPEISHQFKQQAVSKNLILLKRKTGNS